MPKHALDQRGFVRTLPILIIVACVGIVSFLLVSSIGPFNGGFLELLFPKPNSHASSVNGVPLCDGLSGRPVHDTTKWHPLVAKDASGNVICTYGHEHGLNPRQFDGVFGGFPLTQEISYPWRTVSATGVAENSVPLKHRVYKWIGASNLPCTGKAPDGSSKIATAFREELHADANLGATIRFHSFWGQYQLTDCATGEVGYMSVGGVMDYGFLKAGGNIVPLAIDPPASCIMNGDFRQEGLLGGIEQSESVWYGSNSHGTKPGVTPVCDDYYGFSPHVGVQVNISTANFGPVDPNNPGAMLFYGGFPSLHNGTTMKTDALTIWISGFPTDSLGRVNFTGHVNRFGMKVADVAGQAEGPDYIPVVIKNAKKGAYGTSFGPGNPNMTAINYKGDVPGPQGQAGYYVEKPDPLNNAPYGGGTTPPPPAPAPTPFPLPTPTPISASTPAPVVTPRPTPAPTPKITSAPVPTSTPTSGTSIITITAAGQAGVFSGITTRPTMVLSIAGVDKQTWTNVGGDPFSNSYLTFSYTSPTKVTRSQVQVKFTNDKYVSGQDVNLWVKQITIDGVTYPSNASTVYSVGVYNTATSCAGGFKQSIELSCNGYFQY